jgi:hypothetical protein
MGGNDGRWVFMSEKTKSMRGEGGGGVAFCPLIIIKSIKIFNNKQGHTYPKGARFLISLLF